MTQPHIPSQPQPVLSLGVARLVFLGHEVTPLAADEWRIPSNDTHSAISSRARAQPRDMAVAAGPPDAARHRENVMVRVTYGSYS